MILNDEGLQNRAEWERKGYELPGFDRRAMTEETGRNPQWIHFGTGNIFRAFPCSLMQRLLNAGESGTGIIAVGGSDYEVINKAYRSHDNLSILVTLKADGSIGKTVIGSIAETRVFDSRNAEEFGGLQKAFSADSLTMASFTITEKGYSLTEGSGELLPDAAADLAAGPACPISFFGKVTSLLYRRYLSGEKPVAMVSMDNCSRNGEKLYAVVHVFAEKWEENGICQHGFLSYVEDGSKVSFPWTMIDKITPGPDASVERQLEEDGLEDLDPVTTARHSHIAPFVNAEESEYLVVEDHFPNGRLPLEKAGVIFTDRETVNEVERMKVCTCLNPLHTALAIYGCLLGFTRIADEMKDADLRKLAETVGYREGLPVVTDPGVIDPKKFIDTVVNVRIPNSYMPDTPQRIATDTSQKLPVRFGETIRAYMASDSLRVSELKMIPLVFAGWLRYLTGVDDMGKMFALSPDPLLEDLRPCVEGLRLGKENDLSSIDPLLHNARIFGVDLFEAGLAETVKSDLEAELAGAGAVRETLHRTLAPASE
ncbi:MAG: mannitol dehydrogenase family protein [Lachnospiraceae bacterium]|jgi:fructuronate reductase|nr:mannitol dehydrogenase family protein [Lachnospiraceae bacterium]